MNPTFLFLILFVAFGIAYDEPECANTLCLRWEQPSVQSDSPQVSVGVTAREIEKAVNTLTLKLRYRDVVVHYGYYAAANPSRDPQAIGRLWINDIPLKTLITSDPAFPEGIHAVKADRIVKAGLMVADRLVSTAQTRPKHNSIDIKASAAKLTE